MSRGPVLRLYTPDISQHMHTLPRSTQYGHYSSCVLHLLLLLMPVQYIDYCHRHNTGRPPYTSLLFLGCMLSSATAQTTEPDCCRSLFKKKKTKKKIKPLRSATICWTVKTSTLQLSVAVA